MPDYKDYYEMDDVTDVVATKEHGFKSEVREIRKLINKLAQIVSVMMPGVLLSDPATKTGTTSAKAWRSEAFTFKFRGLKVSAAAQEKAFTATTHDTAATKESWYVLSVQTDGTTFTITKAADQTIGTKVLPTIPDNEVPVAYCKMVTGSGGFDATTDDFTDDGTKIATLEFYDIPFMGTINAASLV